MGGFLARSGKLALQSCLLGGSRAGSVLGAGLLHLLPPVSHHSGTRNNQRKLQGRWAEKLWLFLLLRSKETVPGWATGICSGAKDSSLGHRQACT